MSENVEVSAPEGVESTPEAPAADVQVPAVHAPEGRAVSADVPAAEAPVHSGRPAFMQLLEDTLGDESSEMDGFTDGLKQKHIEAFSPEARQTIKNLLRAVKAEEARTGEVLNKREAQLKAEAAGLDNRARGLHAQRAALLKMLGNPNIAKNAAVPDISDDDLMTPEGQRKYLEHLAAKQWKDSLEPLQAQTQKEAQGLAYQKWASDKPEMRDESFKSDMRSLIEERKSINMSLSTADAYEIVRARRSAGKAQTARAREAAVRAASARQIGRGNGTADKPKAPPKGAKATEIAAFLEANPDYQYRGRNNTRRR
jgi:hypothetical protein